MVTLGIDPGFARCGYAFVRTDKGIHRIIEASFIETSPKTPHNKRLETIYKALDNLIRKYNPNNAAIEELFFSKNTKTALKVAESRGIIILALTLNNIDFEEYKPKEIKSSITGSGSANKDAIIKMVKLFTGESVIQDDTADAVAIAIAHASKNRITELY